MFVLVITENETVDTLNGSPQSFPNVTDEPLKLTVGILDFFAFSSILSVMSF